LQGCNVSDDGLRTLAGLTALMGCREIGK
jgi:hypothetical protein